MMAEWSLGRPGPRPPQQGPLRGPARDQIDREAPIEMAPSDAEVRQLGVGSYLRQRTMENLPDIIGMIATLPFGGPLKRVVAGTAAAAGTKLAQTRDLFEAATAGGRFGIGQTLGEGVGALVRAPLEYRASKSALKDFELLTKVRQGDIARQEAELPILAAKKASTDASRIADTVKGQVSAWATVPSTEEGLWRMAHGVEERTALNAWFERELMSSLPLPGMKTVEIFLEDAKTLKLAPAAAGSEQLGSKVTIRVDARDAALGVLGKWTKDPRLYNRVVRALDDAGVGNPKANTEYRNAQAFITFARRSRILEDKVLHPDRIQRYLASEVGEELVRRRAGPLQTALERATPLKPPPPPPEVPPTAARKTTVPAGAAVGGLLGLYGGSKIGHPYIGMAMGAGAGRMFGGEIPRYRGVMPPLGPAATAGFRYGPTVIGEGARLGFDAALEQKSAWDYIMEDEKAK